MAQEIKVVISKDGKVKIDVGCVKGAVCKDLTRNLEQALGTVVNDELKQEYYENENKLESTQELGGGYGGGEYGG